MSSDSRFTNGSRLRLSTRALFAAQFLQVGQTAEGGKAGIGDIEVRKEMQGELQPLKVLHSGDHFKLGVTFELAARTRCEGRARQEEFANVLQPREVNQFFRIEDGSREVDAGDLNRAGGKLR